LTQDQEATTSESASPFSELIRDWLDEGDRLDAKAATARGAPSKPDGRLRQVARQLQPALDRYRLLVLSAIGLIPFAVFALTHHGPPEAVAVGAAVARPAAMPPAPAVTPPAPTPATRPVATSTTIAATLGRAPSATLPAGPLAPARLDSGSRSRRRSSHHHRRRPALARGR
jgi:hypothetical protein